MLFCSCLIFSPLKIKKIEPQIVNNNDKIKLISKFSEILGIIFQKLRRFALNI